jgi:predicted Rossmann-fold nucleotide-binding protein
MKAVPFLLFGRAFWEGVVNWQALAEQGLVNAGDLELFRFVETAEEAMEAILGWGEAG